MTRQTTQNEADGMQDQVKKLMRSNLFVGPNKPFKTIQSAIDAASDYD